MRNVLLLSVCLIISVNLFGQTKKVQNLPTYDNDFLHFGFTIGLNQMDFSIKPSDIFMYTDTIFNIYRIENHRAVGFHLGPVSNIKIFKNLDARVLITLSFGQRNLTYTTKEVINSEPTYKPYTMKIASTFLEVPILLKYKADRVNNFRPYLIFGINPKYDLAARKKIKEEEMPKVRLRPADFAFDTGAGIDWYLMYFKLSTEFKLSLGTQNMLVPDDTNYSSSIKRLNSLIWMFSLHFEG